MSSHKSKRLVSIIIPAMNEEETIPLVRKEVCSVVDDLPYDFEFLVVDNGSTDNTGHLIKAICREDKRWKYIRFSRNFTLEMSITAGYHFVQGEAAVVLYSDLQDPPQVIPRFLKKWEEGYDVVYGIRTVRPGDSRWRNLAVKYAYKIIAWFSEYPIPIDTGDFRLISRPVIQALKQCREYNRYTRGLIAWLGFNQTGIEYQRQPRLKGQSKFPFWTLLFYTFGAITSFSLKPLRIFTLLGVLVLAVCVLAFPIYIYYFFLGLSPRGTTTIIELLLILIGLTSLGIGILGEYLGRVYAEVKHRPLYIIQEAINMEISTELERSPVYEAHNLKL